MFPTFEVGCTTEADYGYVSNCTSDRDLGGYHDLIDQAVGESKDLSFR